jgi:hypothetical protein
VRAIEESAPEEREDGRPNAVARWTARLFAQRWLGPVAVLVCFAGAVGGVVATNPSDDTGPSTCLVKLTTGFDCPGCGGTRAFYYLATANLPEAARHHLMAVFAAPFLVWMYLSWALPRVAPKVRWRPPALHLTPTVLTSFLIAWGVFFLARNLPWEPFTYLYV